MSDVIEVPGAGFDVAIVDIDKVMVDDVANERKRNPDPSGEDADLTESIDSSGLNTPPKARPDGNGGFLVFQGQRRLLAMEKLGWEEIPLIVEDISESEALESSVIENSEFLSRDVHRKDRAEAVDKLVQKRGIDAVADTFGMTNQAVRGWLEPLRDEWEGTIFDPDVDADIDTQEIADDIQRGIRRITGGGELGEEISKNIIEKSVPPTYVRQAIDETDSAENFWKVIKRLWKADKAGKQQIRPRVTFTGEVVEKLDQEAVRRGVSVEEVIKDIVSSYLEENDEGLEINFRLPEPYANWVEHRAEAKDLSEKTLAEQFLLKTLASHFDQEN